MRVKGSLAVFLVWLWVTVFPSNLLAAAMPPSEPVAAEQTVDENHAASKPAIALWDRVAAWVWSKHRDLHRALTRELRELRGADGTGWALVLMSFLYGVFHSAGPGHGKVVLTTYLVTHHSRMNRAIAMGTAAALLQGVTALLLVYGLIGMAGWLPNETETASLWTARASFALLALLGLYLLARAGTSVVGGVREWRHAAKDGDHDHHDHGEGCSCRHLPSAAEIDSASSRRTAAAVVLAIGMRPCSGAVLVLILAWLMDLVWHGALAVLAMSAGTATTIVTLAIVATKARDWAGTLLGHRSPLWAIAGAGFGVLGGGLLTLLGMVLLVTSFTTRPALLG